MWAVYVYHWQAMVSSDMFDKSVLDFINHLPNGPSLLLRAALSRVLKALKGPVPHTMSDDRAENCVSSANSVSSVRFVSKFESERGVQYPLLSVCRIFLQFLVGSQPFCFAPAGRIQCRSCRLSQTGPVGDWHHSRAGLLFFGKSSGSCAALSEVPRYQSAA